MNNKEERMKEGPNALRGIRCEVCGKQQMVPFTAQDKLGEQVNGTVCTSCWQFYELCGIEEESLENTTVHL